MTDAFICRHLLIVVATAAVAFSTLPVRSEPIAAEQQQAQASPTPTRGNRVCCRRNWQNWWTTREYCDEAAGGRQVANRECRNNWNDRWDSRWWSWDGASWNTRVCCRHGTTDKWTIARDCRDSAGFPTSTRSCSRAF
jgi:hypothetical protein